MTNKKVQREGRKRSVTCPEEMYFVLRMRESYMDCKYCDSRASPFDRLFQKTLTINGHTPVIK